jgi:hypothetical protein
MLSYILRKCATQVGINLSNTREKAILLEDVNAAAKEIYTSGDLLDSLDEEVFDFYEDNENQIALPSYAEHARGMRNFDGRYAIDLEDPKNRYFQALNTEVWNCRFRKKKESALSRDISNQSRLVFNIVEPEETDIVLAIVGRTPNSSQITETVVLVAGDLSVETVFQYVSVNKVSKDRATTYDIFIQDVNEVELGVIPNHLLSTKYTVFQVLDDISSNDPESSNAAIEVLFKRRFIPMVNDEDEFQCGDRYDDAIFWKYMENRAKDPVQGAILHGKCNKVINGILEDAKLGVRERINVVPGPYFKPPYCDQDVSR